MEGWAGPARGRKGARILGLGKSLHRHSEVSKGLCLGQGKQAGARVQREREETRKAIGIRSQRSSHTRLIQKGTSSADGSVGA